MKMTLAVIGLCSFQVLTITELALCMLGIVHPHTGLSCSICLAWNVVLFICLLLGVHSTVKTLKEVDNG